MRFSLEHLETFVAAVDAGSFSAAARKLGKVQSQVSTAIAALEDDLGLILFDRSGKYPVLTAHGEDVLFKSRELLRNSGKLAEYADRLALGEQTMLRVALDELVPVRTTTQILSQFGQRWPKIQLEVLWGALGDVQNIVRTGRADLGVELPVNDIGMSGLSFTQLASADFCAVAAPDHPLATVKEVNEATLRPYKQALGTSHRGTRLPDAFKLGEQVWLFEDSLLIRELVLTGEVWSALPRYLVSEDLASGRLIELPMRLGECGVNTTFYCIWNPIHELTDAELWLRDAFEEKLLSLCNIR